MSSYINKNHIKQLIIDNPELRIINVDENYCPNKNAILKLIYMEVKKLDNKSKAFRSKIINMNFDTINFKNYEYRENSEYYNLTPFIIELIKKNNEISSKLTNGKFNNFEAKITPQIQLILNILYAGKIMTKNEYIEIVEKYDNNMEIALINSYKRNEIREKLIKNLDRDYPYNEMQYIRDIKEILNKK